MADEAMRGESGLAGSGTRLGQLQRGRGAGFLAALAGGAAAVADVQAAAATDTRWDRQLESRAEYYAALLHALGADPRPLGARLVEVGARPDGDPRDAWLAIEVLARLADRGVAAAGAVLAGAVAGGPLWRACLDAVAAVGGEALLRRTIPTAAIHELTARTSADALAGAIGDPDDPLTAWLAEVPGLRFVAARDPGDAPRTFDGPLGWFAGRIEVPPSPVAAWMSTEELLSCAGSSPLPRLVERLDERRDGATTARLARAVHEGDPEQVRAALVALGRRGCPDFVEFAEGYLRGPGAQGDVVRDPVRFGCLRYLEALPPALVLTRARGWFQEAPPLRLAGEHLLASHASADDLPLLHAEGEAALAAGQMYRLCSILEALTNVGSPRSLELLRAAYEEVPYALARRRAIEGLARLSGEVPAQAAMLEALWDCEAESRELACVHVDRALPGARARLRALADDLHEADEVRSAAAEALERAPR